MLETSAVAAAEAPWVPPRTAAERFRKTVIYAVLIAIAILFFVPFVWSVSTSFKTLPQTAYFNLLPKPWTLDGYREALTKYDFARYFLNSAILAVSITASNVFLASLG